MGRNVVAKSFETQDQKEDDQYDQQHENAHDVLVGQSVGEKRPGQAR